MISEVNQISIFYLIDFNLGVDYFDKSVRGVKSDRSG